MMTFDDLPIPSPAAQQRSDALRDLIRQTIAAQDGFISFSTFMEMALYHPQWGYYHSDTMTIGKAGDFTTAPEVSPLFAQCMAQQCEQLFAALPARQLLEIGAGTGRLASDLLTALKQPLAHYYILEISPSLRRRQQALLQQTHPDFFSRITWLETLPTGFNGIVLANEVLDALPVACFHIGDSITERGVGWDNDHFSWRLAPSPALAEQAALLCHEYGLPMGYTAEIAVRLPAFMQSLADALSTGVILFADYGYGRPEYYDPARKEGTLTCFYQHRRHHNPLILPGLQDITAHVDFTAVAEQALAHDLTLWGYTTQAAFLLGCGLVELAAQAEEGLSPVDVINLRQGIKTLTLPSEMGDRIKIMVLGKQVDLPPLKGFALQDRRRDL